MARLATGRERNREIRFRVSPEEWEIAKQKAEIAGLPITQYLIKILIDGEIKILPIEELKKVLKEFSEFNLFFCSLNSKVSYFEEIIKDHHDDYAKSEMDEIVNNLNSLYQELNRLCAILTETIYEMKK